jgi:single-strand DNA-binding protein
MINNAVIMGRLTKDPELKTTANGISVTTFTIAVDRKFNKQGEEKQADFIDIVVWRGTADFVCKYFRKGSMIAVQGYIQTRMYEDKGGKKCKAVEIVADEVSFCGDKKSDTRHPADVAPPADEDYRDIPDDDLPF